MITSVGFPRMFSTNETVVKYNHDATVQNLKNLLWSEKYGLFGDPYFGIDLKSHIYDQNSILLQDIIKDEIISQIAAFMPQLHVDRNDIEITQQGVDFLCTIKATNNIDFTTDLYSLVLHKEGAGNDK